MAKTADQALNEPPDVAQLRATIIKIVQSEFCGDNCSEFWMQPIRRAADRIMRAIAHETIRP